MIDKKQAFKLGLKKLFLNRLVIYWIVAQMVRAHA